MFFLGGGCMEPHKLFHVVFIVISCFVFVHVFDPRPAPAHMAGRARLAKGLTTGRATDFHVCSCSGKLHGAAHVVFHVCFMFFPFCFHVFGALNGAAQVLFMCISCVVNVVFMFSSCFGACVFHVFFFYVFVF